MNVSYATYSDALLPAVIRFWNESFQDHRNFFPVTEDLFRARVVQKKTAVEQFVSDHFHVARVREDVVGVMHVGIHSEEVCRILYPGCAGGNRGYVAFFSVDPRFRRQGIGSTLWRRAVGGLTGTRDVIVDGQCLNPFYGNSEGPFTPFWGTPEGISIGWDDQETRRFLARFGHVPRYKGIQLEWNVTEALSSEPDTPEGFEVRRTRDFYPELGEPFGQVPRVLFGSAYECMAAVHDGRTVAVLCFFFLREVGFGRSAIYEATVLEPFQRKGLGRTLLCHALKRMQAEGARTCDVLTVPEVSPGALALYESAGFHRVAEWAIY